MKWFNLIFFLFCAYELFPQKQQIIHLSFNVFDSTYIIDKKEDSETIKFRINNECFIFNKEKDTHCVMDEASMAKFKLINIVELTDLAYVQRKRYNKNGQIKVVMKGSIFDRIYLYEKEKGKLHRYLVHWVEQIE